MKTAIDYLEANIRLNTPIEKIIDLLATARKIEQQIIINAHYDAYMNLGFEHLAIDCSEKYFNETYKTKTIVTEFRDGSVKVETFKSE
jgi:hypothetical protein